MMDFSLTLSAQIAEAIIELISQNEIKPCSRLIERDLMERFKVSQTVIREARLLLESKGVVTTIPRKGSYVNHPSGAELSRLFEMRKALDIFVIGEVALHHTAQDMQELQEISSAAEKAYQKKDLTQFFRLSKDFHRKIYRCSGFLCLEKIYDSLTTLTDLFHYNAHTSRNIELEDDVIGHRRICDAIESGDVERCKQVVCEHIEKVHSSDLKIISSSDV